MTAIAWHWWQLADDALDGASRRGTELAQAIADSHETGEQGGDARRSHYH